METESVRKRIVNLALGQSITFSLSDVCYTTLRSYAYNVGVQTGYLYKSSLNRKARTLTITRTA